MAVFRTIDEKRFLEDATTCHVERSETSLKRVRSEILHPRRIQNDTFDFFLMSHTIITEQPIVSAPRGNNHD